MEEKNCRECKYYVKHYIIHGTRIKPSFFGHCIKKYSNGRYRKTDKVCEHYENRILKDKERKESIFIILETMQERLNEIALILKASK